MNQGKVQGLCVRLHFGMDGSVRINAAERNDSRGNRPTLIISLSADTLMFYGTTVEIRCELLTLTHLCSSGYRLGSNPADLQGVCVCV